MNNNPKRKSLKAVSPVELRAKYGEVEAQKILDNLKNSGNLFGLSSDLPRLSDEAEKAILSNLAIGKDGKPIKIIHES